MGSLPLPLLAAPLLAAPNSESVFAHCADGPVSTATFLGDVAALAERLPGSGHVVNLCRDRYRFAVGFAAALCRRQVNLLPPHDAPDMLDQLAIGYPDFYCLTDGEAPAGRTTFRYPIERVEAPTQLVVPSFPADQPAAVLFTSGSTGRPQPHARSWGDLVNSAVAAGRRLGVGTLGSASLLGTVPHQHSYGLESLLMLALQHGLTLHAERPFYPADVIAALAAAPRPRILVTTPVHLRILLAQPGELPQLDLLLSATAPLSASLAREAEVRFAAPLYEIYGCSEAGQIAARRTAQTEEWRCLDGIALRQDAAGTWASGTPIAVETLLSDAIELHDAEHFLLLGRLADMVNIAGKRASLAHLNHHLNAIDGVQDGAFVATDDDGDTVSRLVAFAVAPGMSAAAILTVLRQRIDPAFLPRPLHLVSALPRNALGKLPREEIARMLAEATRAGASEG
jgi:acyl-coenzyme A synthetase/AMP-(fatty) acid ligase